MDELKQLREELKDEQEVFFKKRESIQNYREGFVNLYTNFFIITYFIINLFC
jgi:hypothetical protein